MGTKRVRTKETSDVVEWDKGLRVEWTGREGEWDGCRPGMEKEAGVSGRGDRERFRCLFEVELF